MRIKRIAGLLALFATAQIGGAGAQITPLENVETATLAKDAFSTGTLTPATGALPTDLWRGSSPGTLEFLIENLPARPATPAIGEAMRRTLLSPGNAPDGAAAALGGKKLLALARVGFLDEAATVASLSSAGRGDPWTNRAEAVRFLLRGDIPNACRRGDRLTDGRDDPFWVKLRVVCYATADERDAADLSLGILRDQYGLSPEDDIFLTAIATGAAPTSPPPAATPLQFAIARAFDLPIAPQLLSEADGGVLVAIARDASIDAATRIAAAENAVAMGVLQPAQLSALVESFTFDVAVVGSAADAARDRSGDRATDAVLYQSVKEMNAPEFLRDKAQRIALALSLADSFPRAYALSVLYADDIEALEGSIVAPAEAAQFAQARMAVGDSVGAGTWLGAMTGPGVGVGALPENEAMTFVELVNLLALLDPQTASQIARAADVSLLSGAGSRDASDYRGDPVVAAHILEAAFDAALEEKVGQAGLAALAASGAGNGPGDAVIVTQSLKAAGMADLQRRFVFEQAWAARFPAPEGDMNNDSGEAAPLSPEERGFTPRLKPSRGN